MLAQSVVAGAGAPIDPKIYGVEDVKPSTKINKNCSMPEVLQKEVVLESGIPVANAVIYENASVSASLRNTLKVGGQRATDLHLFVDQVKTPVVRLMEAPRREGTVGGRPGENVSDLTPLCLQQAVDSASVLQVKWKDGEAFELLVEGGLLDAAAPVPDLSNPEAPKREVPPIGRSAMPQVAAHAGLFLEFLRGICKDVLGISQMPKLIYMPTICADMAVAMKDKSGNVLVNVMAFQQAEACERAGAEWMVLSDCGQWQVYAEDSSRAIEETHSQGMQDCERQIGRWKYKLDFKRGAQRNAQTGRERRLRREVSLPQRVKPEEYRRQVQYWTQRLAMVMGTKGPQGLYDPTVRKRFKDYIDKAVKSGRALLS